MSRQTSFADLDYSHKRRRMRREVFLSEMEGVIPWQVLLAHIEPHYPKAGRRSRPADGDGEHVSHLLYAKLVESVWPANGRCPV